MRSLVRILTRFVALFLIFNLTFSNSAFALRATGAEESKDTKRRLTAALLPTPLTSSAAPGFSLAAGAEEFNRGHGARKLKRLLDERRKLVDQLNRLGATLTLRFVNLVHVPPIETRQIPGFGEENAISFELPPPAVKAFLDDQPTEVRENPFWVTLLEAGRSAHGPQAADVMAGVDAFAPARNAMRRMIYYYTQQDFDVSKPRKKIPLSGDPVALSQVGLGPETVSEAELLARLSPNQRDELARNRVLFMTSPGAPDLRVVLYYPPPPSAQHLMRQLKERYGARLGSFSSAQLDNLLTERFFLPIFVLLRDHMQLFMIFRRWQTWLKSQPSLQKKQITVNHLGGAMHSENLRGLASRNLPEGSRLLLDNLDDPRIPILGGTSKGDPFFSERFEQIMDHLRVTEDGEIELDAPFFVDLFERYLETESRTLQASLAYQRLFPEQAGNASAAAGPVSFQAYSALFSLQGFLGQLKQEDLRRLSGQGGDLAPWEILAELMGKEEYRPSVRARTEGGGWTKEVLHYIGVDRFNRGDFSGAAAAFQRVAEENPGSEQAWINLGDALSEQGKHAEAGEAFRRASIIAPQNPATWHGLGDALYSQGNYRGAVDAYQPLIGMRSNEISVWINMGECLFNLKAYSPAEVAFRGALVLDPQNARASAGLTAALHAKKGDMPGAIAAYGQVRRDLGTGEQPAGAEEEMPPTPLGPIASLLLQPSFWISPGVREDYLRYTTWLFLLTDRQLVEHLNDLLNGEYLSRAGNYKPTAVVLNSEEFVRARAVMRRFQEAPNAVLDEAERLSLRQLLDNLWIARRQPYGAGAEEERAPGITVWNGLVNARDPSRVAPDGMALHLEVERQTWSAPLDGPSVKLPESITVWAQPSLLAAAREKVPAGVRVEPLPDRLPELKQAIASGLLKAGDIAFFDEALRREEAGNVHRDLRVLLGGIGVKGLWFSPEELEALNPSELAVYLDLLLRMQEEPLPSYHQKLDSERHLLMRA